jgi:excisionase family DNA binding protein
MDEPVRATTTPVDTDTVSRRHACARLQIGERRLRVLIQAGRLDVIGKGHDRGITVASLEKEALRKRNPALSEAKSGILQDSVPLFFAEPIDIEGDRPQDGNMYTVDPETIGELLPIARAAAVMGLSDRVLNKLIDTGKIPVVIIGTRRRVNSEVLKAWARGEVKRFGRASQVVSLLRSGRPIAQ